MIKNDKIETQDNVKANLKGIHRSRWSLHLLKQCIMKHVVLRPCNGACSINIYKNVCMY